MVLPRVVSRPLWGLYLDPRHCAAHIHRFVHQVAVVGTCESASASHSASLPASQLVAVARGDGCVAVLDVEFCSTTPAFQAAKPSSSGGGRGQGRGRGRGGGAEGGPSDSLKESSSAAVDKFLYRRPLVLGMENGGHTAPVSTVCFSTQCTGVPGSEVKMKGGVEGLLCPPGVPTETRRGILSDVGTTASRHFLSASQHHVPLPPDARDYAVLWRRGLPPTAVGPQPGTGACCSDWATGRGSGDIRSWRPF
jgi:hypothetical protein